MLAFGPGSGIAGLAGVALSQLGNVGPDLGRGYIVDSFMVVCAGRRRPAGRHRHRRPGPGRAEQGHGTLRGRRASAKIAILVLIVLFVQKRPQGLFAPRGRSVE